MRSRLRVALFSSPSFGLPTLERLRVEHDLALVVTQPDKPAGRGMKLRAPPVAARARALGLPVAQPERLRRDAAFAERLAAEDLDVAITAAYGKILPTALLEVPRHGFLNAHASLLPAYRGAAPIQWALVRGEEETGISVMQTEAGLDTGPVRHVVRTPIGPDETAPQLFDRLATTAAEAVSTALALLARDALPCEPQDHAAATLAPLLTRDDGRIRWHESAGSVYDRWRGVLAWPGSWFPHGDRTIRVDEMVPFEGTDAEGAGGMPSGTILGTGPDGVRVACGEGAVKLVRITPAGRRTMSAGDWILGSGLERGDSLA